MTVSGNPGLESRPVVDWPVSVTHWTCPKAPAEGMTHHIEIHTMTGRTRCRYCKKSESLLRDEQAELMRELIRGKQIQADNARQSKFFEEHPREDAGPDWTDLTAEEQRRADPERYEHEQRINIAWVDCETDGLNAETGHLLEIAVLVTDEELNILDEDGFHAIVYYSPSNADDIRYAASATVEEMHDKTGLWDKLSGPKAMHLTDIDSRLRKYLSRFGRAHQMPVAGNSVRLDMNFMDKHLPKTANFLDYHMRDVSTVAGLASDWYNLPYFEKHSDHTAMVDIRESVRELKHYREAIFKAPFAKMPQAERDEVTADVMSYLLSVGYTITAPGGGVVSETSKEEGKK